MHINYFHGHATSFSQKIMSLLLHQISSFSVPFTVCIGMSLPIPKTQSFLGQYFDFLNALSKDQGDKVDGYLFLGNIVNGGKQSTELLFHILALKVNNPQSVFLIRGKSETEEVCRSLNFFSECLLGIILPRTLYPTLFVQVSKNTTTQFLMNA